MTRFGRYRLLDQLGAGGMAVVTRAVVDGPKGFERELVIKRILLEHSHHPSFARMLATEARLSALLRHPGIVQVHEFGEVDGEYYLAMELVEGLDLSALIRSCRKKQLRLPIGVASYIISQVASALAYAHALKDDDGHPLGIVHRDISPSNIMVTPLGGVKLLDFGIAKVTDKLREDQTRTSIGSLKGKLNYLSPEQCDGLEVDGRSDIFALGIVFYELLTLSRLYCGTNELETMRMIREGNVPPPSSVVADIPAEVDALVLRMLAPWPEQRFPDCDALWAELSKITRGLHGDSVALRRFLGEIGARARRTTPTGVTPPSLPTQVTPTGERVRQGLVPIAQLSSGAIELQAESGQLLRPPSGQLLRPPSGQLSRPPSGPLLRPTLASSLRRLVGGGTAIARRAGQSRPIWAAATLAAIVGAVWLGGVVVPEAPPLLTTSAPVVATSAPMAAASAPGVGGGGAVAAPAPVAAPAAPRAAPANDFVRLSLSGSANAEVLVDGKRIGTVPLETLLPRRAGARSVTVRRAGFKRWTRDVDGLRDATLLVVLERARPVNPTRGMQ